MVESQKRRLLIAVDVEDDLDVVKFLAGLGNVYGASVGRNLTFDVIEPQEGESDDFTKPAEEEPETEVEESSDPPTPTEEEPKTEVEGASGKGKYRCGKCGQLGHNSRSCGKPEKVTEQVTKAKPTKKPTKANTAEGECKVCGVTLAEKNTYTSLRGREKICKACHVKRTTMYAQKRRKVKKANAKRKASGKAPRWSEKGCCSVDVCPQ